MPRGEHRGFQGRGFEAAALGHAQGSPGAALPAGPEGLREAVIDSDRVLFIKSLFLALLAMPFVKRVWLSRCLKPENCFGSSSAGLSIFGVYQVPRFHEERARGSRGAGFTAAPEGSAPAGAALGRAGAPRCPRLGRMRRAPLGALLQHGQAQLACRPHGIPRFLPPLAGLGTGKFLPLACAVICGPGLGSWAPAAAAASASGAGWPLRPPSLRVEPRARGAAAG